MTGWRAWAARGGVALAVVVPAVLGLAGPAAAGFRAGAGASATYATAVLAAPTDLAASVSGPIVTLTWVPSTSPGSAGTDILRSSSVAGPYTVVGSVSGTTSTLTDSPGAGTWYYEAESYCSGWTSPATSPVAASVTVVPAWRGQVGSASSAAGPISLTLSTTSAVSAGDVLTVRTAVASSVPVASITDSAGDIYTRQAAETADKEPTTELWTAKADSALPAGSSVVVTWSASSGGRVVVIVDDFTEVGTAADGSAVASGSSTSPSATTASATGDLVLGVTAVNAAPTDGYTEATGWSALGSLGLSGPGQKSVTLYGGWRIATSSATTHAPTLGAAAKWAEADVALPPG